MLEAASEAHQELSLSFRYTSSPLACPNSTALRYCHRVLARTQLHSLLMYLAPSTFNVFQQLLALSSFSRFHFLLLLLRTPDEEALQSHY
jgi:hypothetical protein